MIAAEEKATDVTSTLPTAATKISAAGRINNLLGTEDFKEATIRTTAVEGKVTKVEYNFNGYTVVIEPNKAAVVTKAAALV